MSTDEHTPAHEFETSLVGHILEVDPACLKNKTREKEKLRPRFKMAHADVDDEGGALRLEVIQELDGRYAPDRRGLEVKVVGNEHQRFVTYADLYHVCPPPEIRFNPQPLTYP